MKSFFDEEMHHTGGGGWGGGGTFMHVFEALSQHWKKSKGHFFTQDWHYARILGLSMCIGVRIISTKTTPEKLTMIFHIQRVCSYAICVVQSYVSPSRPPKINLKTFAF